jgi:hypothetical protein
MRKIIVLATIALIAACAQAQKYTRFMGVEMNKPSTEIVSKLKAKGLKYHRTKSEGNSVYTYFAGSMDDYENVEVQIETDERDTNVKSVALRYMSEPNDTLSAKEILSDQYVELKDLYGSPVHISKNKDIKPDFECQDFIFWFDEWRITMSCLKMGKESVNGLKDGEDIYVIGVRYFQLPTRE